MPYIKPEARKVWEGLIIELANNDIKDAGELNYLFTEIAIMYFRDREKPNYQAINDVVGALEGAKLEFYRRLAAPYEDRKRDENGDVY